MKWDGMETHKADTQNLYSRAEKLGADLFGVVDLPLVQNLLLNRADRF